MKIGIIHAPQGPTLAAFYGESWVSLPKALEALGEVPLNELGAFIELWCDAIPQLDQKIRKLLESGASAPFTYPIKGARFLPPLPQQPVLFTARGNSALHTRLKNNPVCKQPVMEQRYNFNLGGHLDTYVARDGFKGYGWNYEMIVVMGKPCHGITQEQAEDYIFGYTNMLEFAGGYGNPFFDGGRWDMPDDQRVFADWAYADCYNGNTQTPTPIGPWITTRDEVGDPHDQLFEERENGRLVSLASAKAVTFTINEMVAYASGYMTLWPGYLLSTASITYDAYRSAPGKFPEGAYVQVKTEKLGTLRLNLRDERKEV